MTDTILTDGAGIRWRLTDPATGRAERLTPLPGGSTSRRPASRVRYFPPAATTAPVDHAIPRSVLTDVKRAMLIHLHDVHPGGHDAIVREVNGRYPDVPTSLREEVIETYLAHPSSRGPKGR
jgi:hypothetical protein